MHTMDTMGYGHKKYRPPLSPTSFYQHDYYSRHTTLRPQLDHLVWHGDRLVIIVTTECRSVGVSPVTNGAPKVPKINDALSEVNEAI
ncbi:unnamed protein product [Spodoptera exigua]|nr:unnamed protein product [Spodoptera exigua]